MGSIPPDPDVQPPPRVGDSDDAFRRRALEVLTAQLAGFLERSKRRLLTDAERSEVERLETTIYTLQSMGAQPDS